MLEETYVTFEQAKLLKEKGFPQEYKCASISNFYTNLNGAIYEKPTLSIVHKWLREEKNIYINIKYVNGYGVWDYSLYSKYSNDAVEEWYNFKTYEEALSEAIDKALKLC